MTALFPYAHAPKVRLIPTTAERFQQSQGLQNWADRENMKVVSKALNEMNACNTTLLELCFGQGVFFDPSISNTPFTK